MAIKTWTWTAPTTRVDGTPLDPSELAYRLYINGEAIADFPGSLNADGSYSYARDVPHGDYESYLTAVDTANGLESAPSNPMPFTVRAAPNPPTNAKVA